MSHINIFPHKVVFISSTHLATHKIFILLLSCMLNDMHFFSQFVTVQSTADASKEETNAITTTNARNWNGKFEKFLESRGHVYVWEYWIFEYGGNGQVFDLCGLWNGPGWLLWYQIKTMLRCIEASEARLIVRLIYFMKLNMQKRKTIMCWQHKIKKCVGENIL